MEEKTILPDDVLRYLNHKNKPSELFIHIRDGLKISPEDDEGYVDLSMILDKLLKDGYIRYKYPTQDGKLLTESKDWLYKINYDGKQFIESGGYVQQKINEENENEKFLKMEVRSLRISFWVAFGAIGLLVWELIKFYLEHCHC